MQKTSSQSRARRFAAGPFAAEIEKRTIEKLKAAGIAVVGERESESVLAVSLYLACESDGPSCGHHTTLELRQWVKLDRDPRITVAAVTWQNSYSNGIGKQQLQCCLPDMLAVDSGSLINGFIHDFETANPK